MNYYISHSAKGTTWKNYKYIKIVNGRYIYPAKSKALELKSKVNRGLRGIDKDEISYNNGKKATMRYDDGRAVSTSSPMGNAMHIPTIHGKRADYGIRVHPNEGYSFLAFQNGNWRDGNPNDAYENWKFDTDTQRYKYVDTKSKAEKQAIQRNQQANATMARTKKGTAAGRKRIQDDKAAATEKRIQKGLEAGRNRKVKEEKENKKKLLRKWRSF